MAKQVNIICPDKIDIEIYSYQEYTDLNLSSRNFYAIFFCPGSLLGDGKEYFNTLKTILNIKLVVATTTQMLGKDSQMRIHART